MREGQCAACGFRRLRLLCAVCDRRSGIKHCLHTVSAGDRFGHGDDKICELDEFNENLRHIIIQRHDCTGRQRAGVDPKCADPDQRNDSAVDQNIGQRIHQRRDRADLLLHFHQQAVLCAEGIRLRLFIAEGTDHAYTGQ